LHFKTVYGTTKDMIKESEVKQNMKHNAGGGAIYGIGIIGALIYFLQHANSILDGIVGIIYAVFWPAVVVYKVLELFKM